MKRYNCILICTSSAHVLWLQIPIAKFKVHVYTVQVSIHISSFHFIKLSKFCLEDRSSIFPHFQLFLIRFFFKCLSFKETELAAAAEKLAECQETISLLGKHLDSMRPQMEFAGSPTPERTLRKDGIFTEDELTASSMLLQNVDTSEVDGANFATIRRVGSDSDIFSTPNYPSDSEASNLSRSPIRTKHQPIHRPTKSGSSSFTSTPEKHRGVSRFFSTKAKNEH